MRILLGFTAGLLLLFACDVWRLASDSALVFLQPRSVVHRGRDPLLIQLKREISPDDRQLQVAWGCDGLEAGRFTVQIDEYSSEYLPDIPRKVQLYEACPTEIVAALVSVQGGSYHARAIARRMVEVR